MLTLPRSGRSRTVADAGSPRILALVPARSGSKGIPDKNIRPLAGRPLLAYVADALAESGVTARAVLSTDSPKIASIGASVGLEVPFLRPADLSGDETPMLPVVQHAIRTLEATGWVPDLIVLLQPTAPLRRGHHIRSAVELLQREQADSVVTVLPIPAHLSPHYAMAVRDGMLESFLPEGAALTRRQEAPGAYYRDGTVYAFRRSVAIGGSIYGQRCLPLLLSSDESITLDTLDDWAAAERRLRATATAQ